MTKNFTPFFLFILLFSINSFAQLKPQDAISKIDRGINIGNTLDPPTEGGWNNTAVQEYYFDDYKAAGFKCIRIPITWNEHVDKASPYNINAEFLTRIEQIVDWGLARGLYIIINVHHDGWIKTTYSDANKARLDSIWSKVSVRFKNKSENLFFEILNEPHGSGPSLSTAQVDDINARVLKIMRKTNPTRIVIFSGKEYSNSAELIAAAVPDPNDQYLMGYFHSYDPWNFGGEGIGTWGSASDILAVKNKYDQVKEWSDLHKIPIILDEFGAQRKCDFNSRMLHYATSVEQALNHGMAFSAWDDGGDFEIYLRKDRKWNDIKDVLINTTNETPTQLKLTNLNNTSLKLSWTNKTTGNDAIVIERLQPGQEYTTIASVSETADQYIDNNLTVGSVYQYRLRTTKNGKSLISYPVKASITTTEKTPFSGTAYAIPGTVEAENYDNGGEGVSFHDIDASNSANGTLRPTDGVDIEKRTPSGNQVGYIEANEWLEYTVNVSEAGNYHIDASVASQDGGGKLHFIFPSVATSQLTVPKTGDWTTLQKVGIDVSLPVGVQILRVYFDALPGFNLDKLEFTKLNVTATTDIETESGKFIVYPNPVDDILTIEFKDINYNGCIEITNLSGEIVKKLTINPSISKISIADLNKGIYILKYTSNGHSECTKIIKN